MAIKGVNLSGKSDIMSLLKNGDFLELISDKIFGKKTSVADKKDTGNNEKNKEYYREYAAKNNLDYYEKTTRFFRGYLSDNIFYYKNVLSGKTELFTWYMCVDEACMLFVYNETNDLYMPDFLIRHRTISDNNEYEEDKDTSADGFHVSCGIKIRNKEFSDTYFVNAHMLNRTRRFFNQDEVINAFMKIRDLDISILLSDRNSSTYLINCLYKSSFDELIEIKDRVCDLLVSITKFIQKNPDYFKKEL